MKGKEEDKDWKKRKTTKTISYKNGVATVSHYINNIKLPCDYEKKSNYFVIHCYYFCYLIKVTVNLDVYGPEFNRFLCYFLYIHLYLTIVTILNPVT
jgi:hypothetical protein